MTILFRAAVVVVTLSVLTPPAAHAQVQVDQVVLAQQLLSADRAQRSRALAKIGSIPGEARGAQLRTALITALERANANREEAARLNVFHADIEDPEFHLAVIREVVPLRDPAAIPALSRALGTGLRVVRALTEFGEEAAAPVLDVVTSPDSEYSLVGEGLITLRFMVERSDLNALSDRTLARIRAAAEQRLNGPERFSVLWYAIDLAGALDDPELNSIVETIASDRGAATARGITDPDLIERTQKRAADRLAGVPPLPRWSGAPPVPGGGVR